MKKTKQLVEKIFGGIKSIGIVEGTVTEKKPLTVSVSSTKLREGRELTICSLPREVELGDKVLIHFTEDNIKAYLVGVIV